MLLLPLLPLPLLLLLLLMLLHATGPLSVGLYVTLSVLYYVSLRFRICFVTSVQQLQQQIRAAVMQSRALPSTAATRWTGTTAAAAAPVGNSLQRTARSESPSIRSFVRPWSLQFNSVNALCDKKLPGQTTHDLNQSHLRSLKTMHESF